MLFFDCAMMSGRQPSSHHQTMRGPLFGRRICPSGASIGSPLTTRGADGIVVGENDGEALDLAGVFNRDHCSEPTEAIFPANDMTVPSRSMLGVVADSVFSGYRDTCVYEGIANKVEYFLVRICEADLSVGLPTFRGAPVNVSLAIKEPGDIGQIFIYCHERNVGPSHPTCKVDIRCPP